MMIKKENKQKGGVLAFILIAVIAFSILLASGTLLNKTFIDTELVPPEQGSD